MSTKKSKQQTNISNNQPGGDRNDGKSRRYQTLLVDGVEYVTTYTKKYLNRKKWAIPNKKKVHSSIPGTICKVFVMPGCKVFKGEKMMLLETMKMMKNISIPHDGEIKKVYVEEGERIPKGELMVEYK